MAGSTWYSKNLGDAMLAGTDLARIKELFESVHANAGYPKDMAAFIRHESHGGLHCQVMTYFSPAAGVIARKILAQPCQRPAAENLGLLVGSEAAWPALFPGFGR
ncbi:MAG: hypothetical protein WBO47_13340 [Gammaproteobacteria bacterium]